jgi:hypothetical protein
MPSIYDRSNDKKEKDIIVLANFVQIFCQGNHDHMDKQIFATKDDKLNEILGKKNIELCQDCDKLLNHGITKLMLCPYDPKPRCKTCPTHCYAPGYREKVRQVMRFSGMYSIKHGRLDLIRYYWF